MKDYYLFIMSSYIFLDWIRFFAHHGVGRQETLVGNEFVVSLRLKVDIGHAMQTDDVTDTVSYAEVYEAVKKEMEIPSKLLEHVGGRIVKRLFGDFPPIEDIELKLSNASRQWSGHRSGRNRDSYFQAAAVNETVAILYGHSVSFTKRVFSKDDHIHSLSQSHTKTVSV